MHNQYVSYVPYIDKQIKLSLDFHNNDSVYDRSEVSAECLWFCRHKRLTKGWFSVSRVFSVDC